MTTNRLSWPQRRERLCRLLGIRSDADDFTLARTVDLNIKADSDSGKRHRIEELRFSNSDLINVGSLEKGQFGAVDVVKCKLNGQIYARKVITKVTAERYREQCFVQHERDILLQAKLTLTPWVPHLLCAFQTPMQLNLVMQYAQGGTLWDVLECAMDSRVSEDDLMWWAPQAVSAIGWCHSQGFAHRDIKPHNFVLDRHARLQLIDFGCAAPLLPPNSSNTARSVQRPYCLVPCGTCDYISPEILQAHEDALFAAEINGRVDASLSEEGYGWETDWWSLGAVIYELTQGIAPFFAPDVKQTYSRIVNGEGLDIQFEDSVPLSDNCQDLIRQFLTPADDRLGRNGVSEIHEHPWFLPIDWETLSKKSPPATLLLPNVTPKKPSFTAPEPSESDDHTSPFDFSHLFKSSPGSSHLDRSIPIRSPHNYSGMAGFPDFSWGPALDAFDHVEPLTLIESPYTTAPSWQSTPQTLEIPGTIRRASFASRLLAHPGYDARLSDPLPLSSHPLDDFATPVRPAVHHAKTTIPRPTAGTSQRKKRLVSDREALKQMMNLVGASARKKVIESGRKPFGRAMLDLEPFSMPSEPERPKIPSLLLKRAAPLLKELNTSLSLDESAPPSPSPRPGSSMSRRSGSASPFPYVRSTAPSFLDSASVTGIIGVHQTVSKSRVSRSTSFAEWPDRAARTSVPRPSVELRISPPSSPSVASSSSSSLSSSSARDVVLSTLEEDLERLLNELTMIEDRVSSLKEHATVSLTG